MTPSFVRPSRFIARFVTAIAGLALLGAFTAACNPEEDDGNLMVMHYHLKDDVKSWDPPNCYDSVSLEVTPSVLETLYQYSYLSETYKVVPLLAADMPKVSSDRLTYTIPIKHGVMFQNDPCFKDGKGRELKARDFIYGWKRHAWPGVESQGWWVFDGKVVGFNAFHDKLEKASKEDRPRIFDEQIEGIRALDDYTLQIKLIKPYPQLMYVLAMTFTAPIAREAVAKYADEKGNLTDHPVGTGPFTLKEWDRGRRVVLERNPNYHPEFYPSEGSLEYRKKGMLADAGKPLPFLDRVVFDVLREEQPRWLGFMSGKKDLIEIPKDNFATAITNKANLSPELAAKGVRLNIEIGVIFRYISFNVKDKLISNKYLRQAMSAAIDRGKWIDLFTSGSGKKMTTVLPPGIADRPKTSSIKYDFNLERAKRLLEKAGYPGGKGLPTINFDLRGADTMNRQIGDFFAGQWGAIGIKVNVIPNTFPAYLEKMKQGLLQTSYGAWSMDYPDGENDYQLLYGPNKSPGPNDANYENPALDKLYEQMAVMESGPKRAAIVQRMEDIIQEDVPWAYGYFEATYMLSQPWLLNYRGGEILQNKYKYLRVNREVKKRYLEAK
jgi:ABC-type transport system substrate-binding protein